MVIGTASIDIGLIVYNPEPSWQRTLLECMSFFMDYLSWDIYWFVLVLFTLFYYVNAKYNEHVAYKGTSNSKNNHKERIAFKNRYINNTLVLGSILFFGTTVLFVLKAAIP